MTTFPILSRRLPAAFLLLLSLTLGSCGLLGQNDDNKYPKLRLTTEQAAWAAPYKAGATWAFRGPGAQTLSLQAVRFDDRDMPQTKFGSKKSDIDFYRQEISATLSGPGAGATIEVYAEVSLENIFEPWSAELQFNNAYFTLPVVALEAGQPLPPSARLHPQLTLGSRSYQNVLELQPSIVTNKDRPEALRRIFYTKAEGLLRYETLDGSVWTRE
ncbi:hypothetical protein EJV47_21725 [Hymenobacter gummosus]|uniref:Uncharacterized protein n=1 Tax=Hymenobacter gummosus TaxID=1776032 RepID=A0A431TYA7_9BACT|nr:hypothetical protein [Hymenobacter gummosus]RTQ46571.1 hypothetical protein EJV47_21725 [Hymenobacter gummosus]